MMRTCILPVLTCLLLYSDYSLAKQIALTFDDAPASNTLYFITEERTKELIRQLKMAQVPGAMIFANPCKQDGGSKALNQLRLYVESGHIIGNHTCTHPRLNEVGYETFIADTILADIKLSPLVSGQKFFRYPYLNEGNQTELRNQVRSWLKDHNYRNGYVTVDNDDYLVSFKMNEARQKGLPVDLQKMEAILLDHLIEAAEYFDELARTKLGRSPKHVILLHERDATVMFLGTLAKELRNRGWEIISATEAYADPIYQEEPTNLYAGNGLILQLIREKTGETIITDFYRKLERKLNDALGLE